jgi:D-3-phosphoglycerate dehydrogenase / 2-oxoglutarate reductase
MAKPVVLCTQPMGASAIALLKPEAEVIAPADTAPSSLDALLPRADYLVVRNHLRPDFLEQPHKLRAIVRHGTGLDMVPMEAATRQGIPVANVPGANAQAVAEYVVGSFFALARQFGAVDHALRHAGWQEGRRTAAGGMELAGRTVGIIGFGAIGRRIATMCASGLGMRVLAFHPRESALPEGVESVALEALLAGSDFISVNCPLTPQTAGLLNASRLKRMKTTAFLVNAARGELVDELALAHALRTRAIAGAAVDVYATQPLAPDHPFRALDNMLLTPHVAGLTQESTIAMGIGTARQLLQLMRGERPPHLVNDEVWVAWLLARGADAP